MKRLGFLRYAFTLPTDLVAVLALAFVRVAWGARWGFEGGALVVTLRTGSWPLRSWYAGWGATTFFGHGIMIAPALPEIRASILRHEAVHVEQFEAASLVGLLFALALALWGSPWVALVLWTLSPAFAYVAAVFVAVLRGKDAYGGNALEVAAYDRERCA